MTKEEERSEKYWKIKGLVDYIGDLKGQIWDYQYDTYGFDEDIDGFHDKELQEGYVDCINKLMSAIEKLDKITIEGDL